ncbi:MEKHLA domain-containing protein [Cohnella sp. WQ 127256]|uniref:MEKHLA domain-containing protein n=1 Tax=Cohnella sp. WQ 127256 TaxID=2938790 RepID=UPI0021182A58|nr:MEKHLA domain-containing protein [Cohnella sp. WQ 127256]
MNPLLNEKKQDGHAQLLIDSYHRVTGRTLLQFESDKDKAADALFHAPFVLLSHGIEDDPVLNYGNEAALQLWEMTWDEFTRTPSRLTAEPMERSQRDMLLADAKNQGFSDGYYGVRISKSGKRFEIRNVLLWNVVDEMGTYRGQAAVFIDWQLV